MFGQSQGFRFYYFQEGGFLLTPASWEAVARGAGLSAEQAEQVAQNSRTLVEKLTNTRVRPR